MTKHFSTAIVALVSLLGFVFLGLPFYGTSAVKTSGYGVLATKTSIYSGDRAASLVIIKAAIIVLIILFSLTLIFSLIKLLINLKVIKVKSAGWCEWVYVPTLAVVTLFSLVAVWAVTVHCAAYNGWAEYADWKVSGTGVEFMYTKIGLGCIIALLVYGIVFLADIAWNIMLPKFQHEVAASKVNTKSAVNNNVKTTSAGAENTKTAPAKVVVSKTSASQKTTASTKTTTAKAAGAKATATSAKSSAAKTTTTAKTASSASKKTTTSTTAKKPAAKKSK